MFHIALITLQNYISMYVCMQYEHREKKHNHRADHPAGIEGFIMLLFHYSHSESVERYEYVDTEYKYY